MFRVWDEQQLGYGILHLTSSNITHLKYLYLILNLTFGNNETFNPTDPHTRYTHPFLYYPYSSFSSLSSSYSSFVSWPSESYPARSLSSPQRGPVQAIYPSIHLWASLVCVTLVLPAGGPPSFPSWCDAGSGMLLFILFVSSLEGPAAPFYGPRRRSWCVWFLFGGCVSLAYLVWISVCFIYDGCIGYFFLLFSMFAGFICLVILFAFLR